MTAMLNEPQKNAFAAIMRTVEEMLHDIECKLRHDRYRGILYEDCIEESLLENKEEFSQQKARVQEILQQLQEQFGLERRRIEIKRSICGKLYYCLQILDDAKARRMRAYGTAAEGLDALIDPQVDSIRQRIHEMIALLST